jgi:hypothetical protein
LLGRSQVGGEGEGRRTPGKICQRIFGKILAAITKTASTTITDGKIHAPSWVRYEPGSGHKRRFLPIADDDDGVAHSVRSLEAGDLAVELSL